MTEPHDNFAKGDISVVLQSDFARRVDEIMHRMTNCEDGYKFDKGSTRRRKRVDPEKNPVSNVHIVRSGVGSMC